MKPNNSLFINNNSLIQAKPFIKWAGGKGQLLEQFVKYLPKELLNGDIDNYYEPFIGGGALFFWIQQNCKIKRAYINDANPEIYVLYQTIKKDVNKLIDYLSHIENIYHTLDPAKQSDYFYTCRDKYNLQRANIDFHKYDSTVFPERAALTIYLNRTCFNGLFRVNSKGDYNVPFGRYKNPKICDSENLIRVRQLLQNTIISNQDFQHIEKNIKENSFVYFDPPYRPLNKTSSFTTYSKDMFSDADQVRLANTYNSLNKKKNVWIMLSNSDPKNENLNDNYFDELYKEYSILRIKAKRMINCQATKRGNINEILVMSY